jgi:DNA-binding FadR family transcriptional regulator
MDGMNVRERAASGAAALIHFIERNIAEGVWPPGAKLPTERVLERQFGVSRNTLRKSLKRLEGQGKITRHVGRGSFVAEARPAPDGRTADGHHLVHRIQGASPVEVMEVRLMVEPLAAELAAMRATAEDLQRMDDCLAHCERAGDVAEFEHWDGMLHVAIVSAAKNGMLSALYEAINDLRRHAEWRRLKERSVTPERRGLYRDQHRRIVQCLKERDAEQAKTELRRHLLEVRANLFES